ncbi:MAG: hypothetical protein ACRDOV_08845 [Streptomyces sp.]
MVGARSKPVGGAATASGTPTATVIAGAGGHHERRRRTVAGSSSGGSAGAVVAGLTAAAFAVVGFFAYQASAAQDRAEDRAPSASGSPSPGPSESPAKTNEKALPTPSGNGERVVYALERRRVWLVGANEKVRRTYRVGASSVDPKPGSYRVESRSSQVTGSDGVPVENVVRFATVRGTTVGFSAALNGSMPRQDPERQTGGIRERRADGEALWLFATIGTEVVVVP